MPARKVAKKPAPGSPAVKQPFRKRMAKLPPKKRIMLSAVLPPYTLDQLKLILWVAFGKGAGLPIANGVMDAGTLRYQLIVDTNNNNGLFTHAMVEETKLCAERAGEIATSVALFKKHTEIAVTDFSQAADLLESIVSGGQGGLC